MFDLTKFILGAKREYIDLGSCKLPYENSPAYNWMLTEPFLDIWGKRLFNIEEYDEGPYENDLVRLNRGDTVFDVGANIGLFSALACTLGCKVYAFEPLERNVRFLRLLKQFNPEFDITICQMALSDKNGTATLYNSGDDMGGGTIKEDIHENNEKVDKRPAVLSHTNTITLDDFVRAKGIDRLDFIKADIEGSEVALLEGGKYAISRFKPNLSLCSYHRATDPATLENLISHIYSGYSIEKGKKKIYAAVKVKEFKKGEGS